MSFKNFLDLRKKTPQEIQIIEKIILQKRSLKSDIFLALSVIIVASGIIWGISKADDSLIIANNIEAFKQMLNDKGIIRENRVTLSTRGNISSINSSTIVISNANNKEGEDGFSFTVDLSLTNIKSQTGELRAISDLKLGQEVIAKGVLMDETILAHTLIIFKDAIIDIATTTATTTLDIATGTEDIATSSEDSATSTPSFIDKVKDVFSDIVDSIIGTSTATTTENTQTDNNATSTEEVTASSSTTNQTETVSMTIEATTTSTTTEGGQTNEQATSTSFIDTVTDTISNMTGAVIDAISNVTDIITGTTSEPVVEPEQTVPDTTASEPSQTTADQQVEEVTPEASPNTES